MDETPRPESQLEDLVADVLGRIEAGGPQELESACAEHPELAGELRQRVEWLLGSGLVRPEPADGFRHPDRLGDFRLIEPIGQGGMGVVYRAEQQSLGREVALKLVRPEQLFFPEARSRFLREVTTVAGLAHPGIVPVYGVGEEEGVPYFAMELVRGATLSDVIAKLAERDPASLTGVDLVGALDACGADPTEEASSLFDGPWPTVCARIALEVAEALEHAHRRGVLHRDIKPSNVMVTRGGRVMLFDFGLSSSETGDERQTRTGAQVGTLAYMAPEQLRGERELDARADVFALGVTLFELLSLRLPFDASPAERASRGQQDGALTGLRRIDARVPWELETVVQTAGEHEPARRYAGAGDLAADLQRVLEGRPIEARRSSIWLRARRWVQRHPAASLAMVVVTLGPSLFGWQQLRSNRVVRAKSHEVAEANANLEQANLALGESNAALGASLEETARQRDAAEEARKRAERAFDRAFDSIELMLGRVGGEVLEDVPGVERIRRELLEDALRLHAELLTEPTADARQRALHAATLRRSAAIHAELGRFEEGLAALDEEALLLDDLIGEEATPRLERDRAMLDFRRAEMHKVLGELELAELAGEEAVSRLEDLRAREPEDLDALRSLARARMELADVFGRADRSEERREVLDQALGELVAAGVSRNGSYEERRELARLLHLFGSPPAVLATEAGMRQSSPDEERSLELAVDIRRALVAERPQDPSARRALGEVLIAQAVHPGMNREYERAYEILREANELYTRLRAEYPARPVYLDGVAATCLNLSQMCAFMGRREERVDWLDQAVANFEALYVATPDSQEVQRRLGTVLGQLGQVLHDFEPRRDVVRAVEVYERSIDLLQPFALGPRAEPNMRYVLGWTHARLVEAHRALGSAENVVRIGRKLLEFEPSAVDHVYVAQYMSMALTLVQEGTDEVDPMLVVAWEDEAIGLLEQAVELDPEDRKLRKELTDPLLAPLENDPRYTGLLEWIGMGE